MPFAKGHPKIGGRKPGAENKTTTSVKEALTETFQRLGGVDHLAKWARDEPTAFYQIYARLLPAEINVSGINPIADMLRLAEQRRLEALVQVEPVAGAIVTHWNPDNLLPDEPRKLASGE